MQTGVFTFRDPGQIANSPNIAAELDEAATILRQSPSIGIYAGAGAFGAAQELAELAELLQAPVATTISGRGIVPEDHPLCVGYGFGRSGTAIAWNRFRKVRTVLAVGCKYGEVATGAYGLTPPRDHIHIDINPASINANYPASLSIVSDAKRAISGILARLGTSRRTRNDSLLIAIEKARARHESNPKSSHSVTPSRFLHSLRARLDRGAILVTDCGSHQLWALGDFAVYSPRSFLTPADFQAMGFSIPAAISAKLASPERQVVSLVGDGGFLLSGFECLNAAKLKANIVVIVFRDGGWGLIKDAQQRIYRRTPFTDIANPEYRLVAESFGMDYVGIDSDEGIDKGLGEATSRAKPCLVDVNIGYTKSPPYVAGTAPQMFRNLPLALQARIVARYAKRVLFPAAPPVL